MAKWIPKTKRYCPRCKRLTVFEYVKTIDHSECMECGMRSGEWPLYQCGHMSDSSDYIDLKDKKLYEKWLKLKDRDLCFNCYAIRIRRQRNVRS